jgi:hypothetical protein
MDIEVSAATAPVGSAPVPTQSAQAAGLSAWLPQSSAGEVDPDYLLALQLQAQLDGDAELAQQLQNETHHHTPGGASISILQAHSDLGDVLTGY